MKTHDSYDDFESKLREVLGTRSMSAIGRLWVTEKPSAGMASSLSSMLQGRDGLPIVLVTAMPCRTHERSL